MSNYRLATCTILAAFVLSPMIAVADSKRELHRDIRTLAQSVRKNSAANVSESELNKARWHLSRALAILVGRDPGYVSDKDGPYDYDACVEIAYEAYTQGHDGDTARRRALARCKNWRSLDVAQLLYDAYSKSHAPPIAMDLALERAENRRLRGKDKLLEYAIAHYSKSYAANTAVQRAVEEVSQLRIIGFDCVRQANKRNARTDTAFTALDKAFAKCQQRYGEL